MTDFNEIIELEFSPVMYANRKVGRFTSHELTFNEDGTLDVECYEHDGYSRVSIDIEELKGLIARYEAHRNKLVNDGR
jgi:hypothetical protein